MAAAAALLLIGAGGIVWVEMSVHGHAADASALLDYSVEPANVEMLGTGGGGMPTPAASFPTPPASGYAWTQEIVRGHHSFIPPTGGMVVQLFGPTTFTREPALFYDGTAYPHFHTGIDIATNLDSAVVAAAGGQVLQVGSATDGQGHLVGYGNFIVIAHRQGYVTLYAHLDRALVTAGQQVKQGELIGLVGSTGNSTGPHLHFEIRHDGAFLDPLPYLVGGLNPW